MKIKITFFIIALFAVATAFKTRNFTYYCYRIISEDVTRYQVDPVERHEGTNVGEYTCDGPFTLKCVVCTDDPAYQDFDGNWYVDKNAAYIQITNGTYTIH